MTTTKPPRRERALVLLSGGQDSTTCLYWAKARFDEVHALTLVYGQRHAAEIAAAHEVALMAGVATHHVHRVGLDDLLEGVSSLLDHTQALTAHGGYADDEAPGGLPSSFVPGRNLVFLALAGARAAALRCDAVVTGVCETDYSGYPDCREDFINVMQAAINLALPDELKPIAVETPLMHMSKPASVLLARDLGPQCWTALGMTVTCYEGQRPGCGSCPACKLRARGFEAVGVVDPAVERWTSPKLPGDGGVKQPKVPGGRS